MSDLASLVKGFRTIVVDPPWPQKAGPLTGEFGEGFDVQGSRPSQDLPYKTISLEEIRALPIAAAPENAHLYLWTTNKYLPESFLLAQSWGFAYSTTLVWAKRPMGGGLGGAYGISTEFCLFCRRGTLPHHRRVTGTWFDWKRPYDERGKPRSSAKPNAFFDMVRDVSPGPHLEVFARDARDGWQGWGDEYEEPKHRQRMLGEQA